MIVFQHSCGVFLFVSFLFPKLPNDSFTAFLWGFLFVSFLFQNLLNDSFTAFLWGFSICFFFLLLIVLQFVVSYKTVVFALCELQIVQEHIRDLFLFLLGIVF